MSAPVINDSAIGTGAGTSIATSTALTISAGDVVYVWFYLADGASVAASGVSSAGGGTFTQEADSTLQFGFARLYLFRSLNATAGAHIITATPSASTANMGVMAVSISGVDTGGTPNGSVSFTTTTGSGDATSASISSGSNAIVLDGIGRVISDTQAVTGGNTLLKQSVFASTIGAGTSWEAGAATVTTAWGISGHGTVSNWEAILGALSINGAAGAPVVGRVRKPGPGVGGPNRMGQFKVRPPAYTSPNVTVALTGEQVTVSAGTLTGYVTGGVVAVPKPLGPGVRPFNNNQFLRPPRSTSQPPVNPDVTVALTGSAVTVTAGTLTAAVSVTLNGQAVTASAGTLTPSLSLALTGSAATASAGTLTPTMALALSGAAATASAGTLTAAESLSLTGELVTVSAGTITANTGSDVSAALTGQAVTVSAGTLSVSADGSAALAGSAVTASAGTLTPAVAVTLNGQDVTASAGTLTAVVAAALSGQAVTVSAGTLGTQVTGDVVAALTGVEVTVSAGILVATGGDAGTQTTGINGGGGGGSIDRRVRRKLDRKLNKILDDVVAEVVYKNLVTEGKATEAAKVVKPFVETKAASVPEPAAVDWDALTRNAKAVGALLQMWRAIERQREIEADDEEWLMF